MPIREITNIYEVPLGVMQTTPIVENNLFHSFVVKGREKVVNRLTIP